MNSNQIDALQALAEAVDGFVQAFGQDYANETEMVAVFGTQVANWAKGNPVPDTKPPTNTP